VEIALRVGVSEVVTRVVDDLKDESEPYRRMVRVAAIQVPRSFSLVA
jgi:splicing factor 3B subunit 1